MDASLTSYPFVTIADNPMSVAQHTVAVSLSADALAAAAALPISGGADLSTAWQMEGGQGFFRRGYTKGGVFTPLYSLRELRRRIGGRRDQPELNTGEIAYVSCLYCGRSALADVARL